MCTTTRTQPRGTAETIPIPICNNSIVTKQIPLAHGIISDTKKIEKEMQASCCTLSLHWPI